VSAPALAVTDLVVRYGARTAVDGVTFSAQAGRVTALVGPNGAGKTSTVEACVGLRQPSSGTIEMLGVLLPTSEDARSLLHQQVGVMLQDGGLYATARPLEMIAHVAGLYADPRDPAELLATMGVDPKTRTALRRLSGGEQRRVAAAAALVGRPLLAFLDEPTTGLDAMGRRSFHDLIREQVSEGLTVLLTTHLMDDVERLADHVIVMAGGRIIREGSVADLTGSEDAVHFRGALHMDLSELASALPPGTEVIEPTPGSYRVTGSLDPLALSSITAWCGQHGVTTRDLQLGRRSLEDVVIDLVGDLS